MRMGRAAIVYACSEAFWGVSIVKQSEKQLMVIDIAEWDNENI